MIGILETGIETNTNTRKTKSEVVDWWWIGLNDKETEGEFVWPVNGPANYTYWDVENDSPYPGEHSGVSGHSQTTGYFRS